MPLGETEFLLYATFTHVYPELCLLLDRTQLEGKHAGASENAAAVFNVLSFTLGHRVIG